MPATFRRFRPFETSAVWKFENPENGRIFTAPDKKSLIQRVVSYRADNQFPSIDRLDLVIENYLCNLSCNVGKCESYRLSRGLLQYIKGGIALLTNMWINDPVPQAEADRRSAICAKCPENIFPDKGPFIQWADDIAEQSVGDKRSKHHNELGNCACCSCPLRAKVFYKPPFHLSEVERECMSAACPECWQLEK